MNNNKEKPDVAIISAAPGYSNKIAIRNMIDVIEDKHEKIHLFRIDEMETEDDDIKFHKLKKPWHGHSNILFRTIGIIFLQIYLLIEVIKLSDKVKYFILMQSTQLFIPHLFLLNHKGNTIKITTRDYTERGEKFFVFLVYRFVDRIVVFTESMIKNLELHQFSSKITMWNYNYVKEKFNSKKSIEDRSKLGYIGRLTPEKNIINIIKSADKLEKDNRFVIGGSGRIEKQVEKMCDEYGVDFLGHIPHQKMPRVLNDMKILILPSENEGFPKIVTEAMACSVIVLSTPVGGVRDIIKDGKNGFLLKSISSSEISRKINQILRSDELEEISKDAVETVQKSFSYGKAVEEYERLLEEIRNT